MFVQGQMNVSICIYLVDLYIVSVQCVYLRGEVKITEDLPKIVSVRNNITNM